MKRFKRDDDEMFRDRNGQWFYCRRVFMSNVAQTVTKLEIGKTLCQFGGIEDINIVMDKTYG